MNGILRDKVYGCLAGGVIGDAMGAPVENMTFTEIEQKHGLLDSFEGAGTDDSAVKLILCDALVANDGYITADSYADSFLKYKDTYYKLFYFPVLNMLHKLEAKLSLPVNAGFGNMQSSSSAMSISPMGLINACDPRQAAAEAYEIAGLIHSGDTSFCRDAAASMAAAVAEAMKPDATVESVVDAATRYLHPQSAVVMLTAINKAFEAARRLKSYREFRSWFYDEMLQMVICDSRETIPAALVVFWLAKGDPTQAILYGANFGRDADTIATMAGALAGAFAGTKGLRQGWLDELEANNSQQELADTMCSLIKKRKDDLRTQIKSFDSLL